MKIGFVLDDTLDSTDGVQQYVLTLGAWFSCQGHEVHYLVGETSRTDLPHIHSLSRNVKVRFNGNRMSMPLPARRANLRKLLAAERYDVLHVQVPYSPFMAGRLIQLAPASTVVIGTFHIAPHSGLVRAATRALAIMSRRSLLLFDKLISNSAAAQSFARQTYRIGSDIIPNVVVVDRFAAADPYPLPGSGPVIMFLGRLVPRKGCQILLEAVKQIVSKDPNIKLRVVICGRGPLEAELKQYANEHGLSGFVQFAGYISEDDKPRYLKAADIAVFPSTGGESFGIVLLEAMAAGNPVVLGAANAGYQTVLAPYPELLFPVGDAGALAAKLGAYLHDPAARQRAQAWQQQYITQFDVGAVGTELLQVYNSLGKSKQKRHAAENT